MPSLLSLSCALMKSSPLLLDVISSAAFVRASSSILFARRAWTHVSHFALMVQMKHKLLAVRSSQVPEAVKNTAACQRPLVLIEAALSHTFKSPLEVPVTLLFRSTCVPCARKSYCCQAAWSAEKQVFMLLHPVRVKANVWLDLKV